MDLILLDFFSSAVGRTVIDHDVFEIRVTLIQNRVDRLLEIPLAVVDRRHQGDPRPSRLCKTLRRSSQARTVSAVAIADACRSPCGREHKRLLLSKITSLGSLEVYLVCALSSGDEETTGLRHRLIHLAAITRPLKIFSSHVFQLERERILEGMVIHESCGPGTNRTGSWANTRLGAVSSIFEAASMVRDLLRHRVVSY